MEHVAIMDKKLKMLKKIVSGEKTIESRWYINKVSPWNKIRKNEIVYFKNSGENITVKARVAKVLQFRDLNNSKTLEIIKKHGIKIGLIESTDDINNYYENNKKNYEKKNYCILIFLKDISVLKNQFDVDKKGFGSACAWLAFDGKIKKLEKNA